MTSIGLERSREATKTNEKAVRQLDGLLFQGRIVPTEVQKRPSELSGEILLGSERQCQGISPE
jgi:hypothetical protein